MNGWYTQPEGGEEFNFSQSIIADTILYAHWTLLPLTSINDVREYLETQTGTLANPVYLPVQTDLGTMPQAGSGWKELLGVISTASRYVYLDLSACTMNGTEFNPDPSDRTGKDRIMSLVLPDVAESIPNGEDYNSSAFRSFSLTGGVSGARISSIGDMAFYFCSLKSVNLPLVTDIGEYA
jgi:hypothetical protein